MGLLDKIKKPLDDYIAVSHFIKKLSGINNFPVYDVITYLNHYDFVEKINAFYIDMDFKIIPFHSVDYQNLESKLNEVQAECLFTDFVWTDSNFEKLKEFSDPKELEPFYELAHPHNSMHWYFKKQDLADFEPLQGYVDFLEVKPTPKQYPLFYKNDFFDLTECESMISGFDPNDGWRCSEREQAYSLVLASVHNGKFKPHPQKENDYLISADDFREWLISKDIFIDGFTNISNQTEHDRTTPVHIKEQQSTIDGLQTPITELESELKQAKDDEIAKLQTQLKAKDERIAELERQLDKRSTPADMELTGTSKKAVTKLLYALLLEHNYSIDGTTKGATNNTLENLTTRYNVPITRETIAKWLNEINTLHHDKNK